MDENWLKTRKYVRPKIDPISIYLTYPPAKKPLPQPQNKITKPIKPLLPAPRPVIKKKKQPGITIIKKPKIASLKKTKRTETKPAKPPEEPLKSLERYYIDEPDKLSESILSDPPALTLRSTPGDLPDNISAPTQKESVALSLKNRFEEKSDPIQTSAIKPEPVLNPPLHQGIIKEAIPLYKENPSPKYPRLARRRGYQGTVVLNVLVSKEGKVAEVEVIESSHYSILDKAALTTVKKWRFKPGERGSQKVDMRVRVPIRFQLHN